MKLVSVIVPTYNRGEFLETAVRSVLDTHDIDLDVHIVDDGSTDSTPQVLEKLCAEDKRIVVHRQANKGWPAAKNLAIRNSSSKYIAYCDADDAWLPGKLAKQVPVLEAAPKAGVVYTRAAITNHDMSSSHPDMGTTFHRGRITEQLLSYNCVTHGPSLIRRTAIEGVNGYNELFRMGSDWDLWLRLSIDWEFEYINDVTYLYRVWGGQLSKNWRGRFESDLAIVTGFAQKYAGAVSSKSINQAYARLHVQRGRARAALAGEYWNGITDCMRAIGYSPGYSPAWKTPARMLLWSMGAPRDYAGSVLDASL